MALQPKDYITVIGILATLIISCFNLFVSFRNSKKTLFINSITSSRIKWIETLRNTISEFCGLTHHFSLTILTEDEKKPIIEKIDRLRFLIKLQLNRNDKFDKKIIEKIDLIPNLTDIKNIEKLQFELNELINLTQDLLKLEWEGAKEESKKGNLTKKTKKELYDKYLQT